MTTAKDEFVAGGSFLIRDTPAHEIFTPEDLSEEQQMMRKLTQEFIEAEITPQAERIEHQDWDVTLTLMRKAGELGLLSVDIPTTYGGLGLDLITSTVIAEQMSEGGSFAISLLDHSGIGSLPIAWFGNAEQKARYLPLLATGAKVGSYALTEPGSGSDALSAKTRAVLSPDGTAYILNGTKQFITNAAFADLYITYAKVNGDKFTAFIIDKDTPGVALGPEEKKMGIKGTSTRSVILENARVPADNLLYEIGRGHKVAFDLLNIGRLKLGAGCLGLCKLALREAVRYAKQRTQFGQPIASFGLIQKKLAEMTIRTYVAESMIYRTAGLIERNLSGIDQESERAGLDTAKGVEEYAVECSINKVYASEALDYVADETVQIFGGYGYIADFPAERIYRDARINRLFEGTNEINRLLIPTTLFRRALQGRLPLFTAAQKLVTDLLSYSSSQEEGYGDPLHEQIRLLESAKKIALMVAGSAVQKFREHLQDEQEILGILSDLTIELFAMESALLRALKSVERDGKGAAESQSDIAKVYINDAFARIELLAKEGLAAMEEGDTLWTQLSALRKLTRYTPVNTTHLRRAIARRIIDAEGYQA
ncbi:MAG: acyl-CoA dehydrogenase [Candidatus Methylomirabilis oxygeniifera]|uniref:Acyl-CoA dehydrogenase n=1 Tax=Methylomirabilis oxygeniifera TaxID=671143 RepID=D5MEV8_METO1|nr:MAG: acyl-CoA dehydrogenase [Candidatus Methylomirabilis oxyfera]CBE68287.1 Acyl-CoA dehydrogenase [Candidatus Methylomirabilis oxyfera]